MRNIKRKEKASKLTDHIGYWMRLISNDVSYSFAKKLEITGVTVAEWVVLRKMYESNDMISPSAVAEVTGLTRGAISKLITRLLGKGLVNRKEASDDRRFQDLELTLKAIALVPKLASLADQNDEEFFSILTPMEQGQLKVILKKLANYHQIKTAPIQ
ncbi:transcriptional regulator, MarR family [Legionella gratiana]|uniref:Transcriptional regulator, MarR family n=1 Tax=Legionella gratiana TaxID=45066 RepID=A0A378J633_9GAMM|nr:MarR family transcriptional regulator [Legionella gratiana]KTD06043.1 transcriptional regulator, MarR family [Legionella gratiana]STX42718.1 transcriptional regulator, MarR family [Legionella gratiana]